jgi:hypothetical protein
MDAWDHGGGGYGSSAAREQLGNFAPSCQCFLQEEVNFLFFISSIGSELLKRGPSRESESKMSEELR